MEGRGYGTDGKADFNAFGDFAPTVRAGRFEWCDRIALGKEPVRFFETTLKRVGDTDWPAAGAMAPKRAGRFIPGFSLPAVRNRAEAQSAIPDGVRLTSPLDGAAFSRRSKM